MEILMKMLILFIAFIFPFVSCSKTNSNTEETENQTIKFSFKTNPNFLAALKWIADRKGANYQITDTDRAEFHGFVAGIYYTGLLARRSKNTTLTTFTWEAVCMAELKENLPFSGKPGNMLA
jgi:hypothetical protein